MAMANNMSSTSNDPQLQVMKYTTSSYPAHYVTSVFISAFVIMLGIAFILYICRRIQLQGSRLRGPITSTSGVRNAVLRHPGLDEAALSRLPELPYSQAKVHLKGDNKISCSTSFYSCSICLGDYKESDLLRLLPDCGHVFHSKCVDPWIRMHPTCPICRNFPLAPQLPTIYQSLDQETSIV